MGSVKDFHVVRAATENEPGVGEFVFSDRYSVFDWGEMPDHIQGKGYALCTLGLYFFKKLEEMGIKHHCLGVKMGNSIIQYEQLSAPVNSFLFKTYRVVKPEVKDGRYDYSVYKKISSNYLIPLEVIYRNTLPEGSSVFRRLKEGSITPAQLGLKEMPTPGQVLEKPIVDVSTKLEATDRYIGWDEAQEIAGLSTAEVQQLKDIVLAINDLITREVKKANLINEDGKFEFAFDEHRNLVVVDILGTPDECRFTWNQLPVSKEVLRKHYREFNWYKEVEEAKKKDKINWKSLVQSTPPALPPKTVELVSQLYKACCNEITGKRWFDVPSVENILAQLSY
ncbi:MAG: phosphoribosylaminoimidazolesuccinocarboxamide synthase [Spirochaetes bacterium]|nr:phosphoribosylaminoimidazolesuccinocarboxamide synthase [Spirochaetota bacterium]